MGVHRPNKVNEDRRSSINWVNGSGQAMPPSIVDEGWRSERGTIGYDLVSLNHYAVRSAETFLVKRARGRANHVDRELGLNYWIRMDFNSVEEDSIQRHLPRNAIFVHELTSDATLAALHQDSVAWYVRRIAQLKQLPDFAKLLADIQASDLTDAQRVALALQNNREGEV
jgi:hypothetical protein